jgi:hypothetical protein
MIEASFREHKLLAILTGGDLLGAVSQMRVILRKF